MVSKRIVAEFLGVVAVIAVVAVGPLDVVAAALKPFGLSAERGANTELDTDALWERLEVADSLADRGAYTDASEIYRMVHDTLSAGVLIGEIPEVRALAAYGLALVHGNLAERSWLAGRNAAARSNVLQAAEWFQLVMALPGAPDTIRENAERGYQAMMRLAETLR